MSKEKDYIISIGKSYISWSPVRSRKASYENAELYKKARRRNNEILKTLKSFSKPPTQFVTLVGENTCDIDDSELTNLRIERCHKAFKQLQGALRYMFSESWFFWKMEWSKKGGVHYHLCGSFNTKLKKKAAVDWITRKWNGFCSLDRDDTVSIVKYDHDKGSGLHIGYITTPRKRKNDMVLLSTAKGKRTFGVIHKHNAPIVPATKVSVSAEKMKQLRNALAGDLKSQSKLYKSKLNVEQLEKVAFDTCGFHVFNGIEDCDKLIDAVFGGTFNFRSKKDN